MSSAHAPTSVTSVRAVRGTDELRRQVASIEWYHTLELAPGIVTPGWFDTREVLDRVPIPSDLSGRRCLDIGSFDGFWAFAMEARGATEVVAIDVPDPLRWDWPADATPGSIAGVASRRPGAGFALAAEALRSNVQRRELSIYELDPDEVGTFDFVYVGSLLLHLRDPVGALMNVRRLCRGSLLLVDAIEASWGWPGVPRARLDGCQRPWWWKPNLAALVRMVQAAGFETLPPYRRIRVPAGAGQGRVPVTLRGLRQRAGREALWRARLGDRHAAVLARPRPVETSST
jgi:tRNA (mo5U34)-methyltransferase